MLDCRIHRITTISCRSCDGIGLALYGTVDALLADVALLSMAEHTSTALFNPLQRLLEVTLSRRRRHASHALLATRSDICIFSKDVMDSPVSTGRQLQQGKAHKPLMQWQEITFDCLAL